MKTKDNNWVVRFMTVHNKYEWLVLSDIELLNEFYGKRNDICNLCLILKVFKYTLFLKIKAI